MTKATKLYLAGPMRGYKEFNFPAFFTNEYRLATSGYKVINPARHDNESGFHWSGLTGTEDCAELGLDVIESLDWDLRQIVENADGVALLDGWDESAGAQLEIAVAQQLQKPVATVSSWRFVDYTRGLGLTISVEELNVPSEQVSRAAEWLQAFGNGGDTIQTLKHTYHREGMLAPGEKLPEIDYGTTTTAGVTINSNKSLTWNTGDGEIRTTSATGGQKGVKQQRYDLIPVKPLEQVATHYGIGANKYADRNWEKGYEWSKSYAALQRHLNQFWGGEDVDAETGSPHLAAVVFHALALLEFANTHPEFDDRSVK